MAYNPTLSTTAIRLHVSLVMSNSACILSRIANTRRIPFRNLATRPRAVAIAIDRYPTGRLYAVWQEVLTDLICSANLKPRSAVPIKYDGTRIC